MSDVPDIASKWNARYAFSGEPVPAPAEVLSSGVRFLPASSVNATPRRALDLACGRAGNGEWLAARGFDVTAWDIASAAIDAIRSRPDTRIRTAELRDVRTHPPLPNSFDVIVVARFLDRGLCPAIAEALRPGGVLFYQTFTKGLSNPDFLLKPGELPMLFPTLRTLSYEESGTSEPSNPDAQSPPKHRGTAEARLIAVN